jgi:hypothetical protein
MASFITALLQQKISKKFAKICKKLQKIAKIAKN